MRSLYQSSSGSLGLYGSDSAHDPPVYRSVTLDSSHGHHGVAGFNDASFDGSLSMPMLTHSTAYHHPKQFGLSMPGDGNDLNPKYATTTFDYDYTHATQQADFQPTLNLEPEPAADPALTQANQIVPSSSSSSSSSDPSVPPPVPMWVEPNSHFYCSCIAPMTPNILFDTVVATLTSLTEDESGIVKRACPQGRGSGENKCVCTIDCTPAPDQFKVTCCAYVGQSAIATPFIVRVWDCNGDGNDNGTGSQSSEARKYCVEFQRRQGDVLTFYELFRTARSRIQAAHPFIGEKGQANTQQCATATAPATPLLVPESLDPALAMPQLHLRSWSAPSLPSSAGLGHSFEKDHMCETIRSLLAMCASSCVDIRVQGVQALAELSASTPAFEECVKKCKFNLHEILVAEGVCQQIIDCLPLQQLDINRASLTALANLSATQSEFCSTAVSNTKCVQALVSFMSRPCSGGSNRHVVRECARFLSNCAHALGRGLLDSVPPTTRQALCASIRQLSNHKDESCRKHAEEIARSCAITLQQGQQAVDAQ